MSVACQKQYTLTVKTPLVVDAYWTMEEAGIGVNKVDKVNGVALTPQVAAGFDSTGYNGGPGFIGNGLQSLESGSGNRLWNNPASPFLAITGNLGWSICMWIQVLNWDEFSSNLDILWLNGVSQSIEIHKHPFVTGFDFLISDNAGHPFLSPANFNPVLGVWYFLHVFYDPVLTQVGYQVNLGAAVLDPTVGVAFGQPQPGQLRITQNWQNSLGGPGTVATIIDEVAMKLSRILTPSEVAYLYNGGAGRTWPL